MGDIIKLNKFYIQIQKEKIMKKIFLTLIMAIMCMALLTVFLSAEAYTVSSNDEYETAYENAVGGDTIIIESKLTCDIYANKSITYVLKADWESSKLVVNQSNVEVSFIADGGNYRIMPTNYSTTDGWMNIAEIYEKVVINLGGMNGGTLTIDGSNATYDRVSYVSMVENVQWYPDKFPDICLNLLDGSAIANFNTSTEDDNVNASILYAKTVNMYEGAEIYANRVISAPLFKSCYFNMYGGEIFGNLLTSTRFEKNGVGFIYADRQFVMYDGKISKNIFKAIHSTNYSLNVAGFITTNQKYYGSNGTVVLGGEVGDRYVSGTGDNEISAVFGVYAKDNGATPFYYNTGITAGDVYIFTGEPQLTLDQETGKTVWKVSNATLESANNYGYSWRTAKKPGDKVAIFLDAEKKNIAGNNFDTYTVINAYINGVYAQSGSNTIAIPSGYDLWSTSGTEYCHTGRAYTLDEVKAVNTITLYTAYNAERETVDGTTMCSGCKTPYTCSNPEHDLEIVSISYDDGYDKVGKKTLKCNTCGLEKASVVDADPLFACEGYSTPENGRGDIAVLFEINYDAIEKFEKANTKSLSFGAFAILYNNIGDKGILNNENAIIAEVKDEEKIFVSFEMRITGFETDEQKDAQLAIGAYVLDEEGTVSYIQAVDSDQSKEFTSVSYNDIYNQPTEE